MKRAVQAGSGLAISLSAHTLFNSIVVRRPGPGGKPVEERVSVLIPARNEAANIGDCLDAILASKNLGDYEVIVLDDGSTDATASLAGAKGVRVVVGDELPTGWLGKPHACAQLGRAATGTALVFIDADVRVEPEGIARAVWMLRDNALHLVSPYPRQIAETPTERLVQPLLQWLWLTFVPLRWAERSGPPSLTAANGQLMVVDTDAYRDIGGHEAHAVRSAVVEDVWLARTAKRAFLRVTVADGHELASCRMYSSWEELSAGYAKSLWAATGSPLGATAIVSLLTLAFVVPPVAVITGPARRLAAMGFLAAIGGRYASARTTGGRASDSWQHPASVVALSGLVVRSWLAKRRGTLSWKGRRV